MSVGCQHQTQAERSLCSSCGGLFCVGCSVEILGRRCCGECKDRLVRSMEHRGNLRARRGPLWAAGALMGLGVPGILMGALLAWISPTLGIALLLASGGMGFVGYAISQSIQKQLEAERLNELLLSVGLNPPDTTAPPSAHHSTLSP